MSLLVENTLRQELHRLHEKTAEALPAMPYCHEGPHFAEWLAEVLPGCAAPLAAEDARYVLALLKADVRSQVLVGRSPSPELWATMLRWRHGAEGALDHFVQAAWARSELPDENVTWLLLHPERIAENFPMYCEAR